MSTPEVEYLRVVTRNLAYHGPTKLTIRVIWINFYIRRLENWNVSGKLWDKAMRNANEVYEIVVNRLTRIWL